ncbi:MAG: 1-acyl-sn-glycerol-3-phosphate acyltransferase [Tabrizicola sp.]|uniref:1-acyl-sn-glycerol-3-phosphate acyltransferase n=1 Tax=Tabrizicola sp. TaxID=2005166 RepID=UPI00273569EC|nr:1-acyl-sn-glycerol-3-phosphate acyltransferase [Tabrizicola sp.]MDP3261834.1 1-acyl-sn-glycerol-3-phosphate acyltransferase [Tabrizicola sp.]MDP3649558.1 1-acyl-sn-glycerol-3-phosphate acyltransferase [Paracoccaceae bacterium]MDZ4069513.1 1-acyl-sn-glycerol-3-phosphate acyltransferase [Tabrizicola sp.]
MFGAVAVPVWLLILILGFATVSFATHFLFPSVRWFFRRRAERALSRLNARLDRKVDLFKLARRADMVARLAYDPKVVEAAMAHAAETGVPGSVAFEEARTYAREIVPGFSATLYFGFATRAAKWLSRLLFRVRVGKVDKELAHVDPKATVIFVMNHRSNVDYVLVTWLVADRAAISYAVGEWARVWPLSVMIRAMGAYFIRRGSRNALYRRVLARYVQMATAEGTTQAFFPEGGLSLDGRVGPAKMGLLSYVVEGFDPGGRDVVFVPVGLAYDRVLEDRVLVAAAAEGGRRFRVRPLRVGWYAARLGWKRMRGRFKGFGTAAAAFGAPVSLKRLLAEGGDVETLGERLMAAIAKVVPVVSVPLVARALAEGPASRDELRTRVLGLIARLEATGAVLKLPPQGIEAVLAEGLTPLIARGVVNEAMQPVPGQEALLAFYASSVPTV